MLDVWSSDGAIERWWIFKRGSPREDAQVMTQSLGRD
jgi:hypothetical protein